MRLARLVGRHFDSARPAAAERLIGVDQRIDPFEPARDQLALRRQPLALGIEQHEAAGAPGLEGPGGQIARVARGVGQQRGLVHRFARAARRRQGTQRIGIGLTRRLLAVLILSESIIMATASGLIGTAIGACANFILFYHPIDLSRWMESITWGGSSIQPILFCVPSLLSNLLPLLAMILLGFAVAVLPTWRLYRLRPVEALREG